MTGQDYVTKERLLNGARQVEPVETEVGTVPIRPLTEAEKAKVETLGMRGIVAKSKGGQMDGMEINMEALWQNDYEANMVILACGLSYDKDHRYTVKEIKEATFNKKVKAQLIEAIKDLSGMEEGTSKIVDSFREESRRRAVSPIDPVGTGEANGDREGVDAPSN